MMRTLNVSISNLEFEKFGFESESLSFSELLDFMSRQMLVRRLEKSVQLAEECGLSEMTMEEIDAEVKAVRANAKSGH